MEEMKDLVARIQQYQQAETPNALLIKGHEIFKRAEEISDTYHNAKAQGYTLLKQDEYILFSANLITHLYTCFEQLQNKRVLDIGGAVVQLTQLTPKQIQEIRKDLASDERDAVSIEEMRRILSIHTS